jgi:hypothetical protein
VRRWWGSHPDANIVTALAITHADRVRRDWAWIDAHDTPLAPFSRMNLDERRAATDCLGAMRASVVPLVLGDRDPGSEFAERVSGTLGVPLRFVSYGPATTDVRER